MSFGEFPSKFSSVFGVALVDMFSLIDSRLARMMCAFISIRLGGLDHCLTFLLPDTFYPFSLQS